MSNTQKLQDYKSHRRMLPLYHYVTFGLIILTLIGSIVNLTKSIGDDDKQYAASLLVAISIILVFMFFFARMFALRAQDRAIRAEENLRSLILTGKSLDPRITMSQTIALRFAPDEEFVELTREIVEKNMSNDDIKRAIKQWKADHHRV
ncbi:MAG: DUF6526 family protein [Bacteroidia bacterium]